MRIAGIVLLTIGMVGIVVFGIQSIQETETFSFLGMDIGVSSANWTPVIMSVIVFLIGTVLISVGKRKLFS
jgi:hypothetical protein